MTILSKSVAGPTEASTELGSLIVETLNGSVIVLSAMLALAAVAMFA